MEDRARSQERITQSDLARLADLAEADLANLFDRMPDLAALYRDRVLCVALCQGAALHYADGRNGVKDFDVWTFFAAHPARPFPSRRRKVLDFGPSKFGRSPGAPARFTGRRVDMLGRSLPEPPDADPIEAIRHYLRARRTPTAKLLGEKAVVLISPQGQRGTVACGWP
jgi:hypothetical protein